MGRLLAEGVSTPKQEVTLRRREWSPRDEDWDHPTLDNRLSRKYLHLKDYNEIIINQSKF